MASGPSQGDRSPASALACPSAPVGQPHGGNATPSTRPPSAWNSLSYPLPVKCHFHLQGLGKGHGSHAAFLILQRRLSGSVFSVPTALLRCPLLNTPCTQLWITAQTCVLDSKPLGPTTLSVTISYLPSKPSPVSHTKII